MRVHESDESSRVSYSLSPLFAGAVYEELREEPSAVRARLMEATAEHYQSLLEHLPDALRPEDPRAGGGSAALGARYRLEAPEYRKYVPEWLRAMLGNPERDPGENRASLAAVVLKLHWWWALFVSWEVFDHVLSSLDLGVRLAGHLQTGSDFSEERRLMQQLREFDAHWPKESRWTVDPDPADCRRAREAVVAVRRALGCDYAVEEEGATRPVLSGDLRAVAAITDAYLGDLWLYEYRLANRPPGAGEQAAGWMESARRRFAGSAAAGPETSSEEDLSWSILYVIAGQCSLEWARGNPAAALCFGWEGLERCRASDGWVGTGSEVGEVCDEERDAKTKVYLALGEGLLNENPRVALACYRLAHWEAFAYLWDPPTDPPNDDYTVTHYRIACERFIHALRRVYAEAAGREVAMEAVREVRSFWLEWSRKGAHPCPAPDLDREQGLLETLLEGWHPGERALLTPGTTPSVRERALTQQYRACAAALFPEVPGPEDLRYRDDARAFTHAHLGEVSHQRETIMQFVRESLRKEGVEAWRG